MKDKEREKKLKELKEINEGLFKKMRDVCEDIEKVITGIKQDSSDKDRGEWKRNLYLSDVNIGEKYLSGRSDFVSVLTVADSYFNYQLRKED